MEDVETPATSASAADGSRCAGTVTHDKIAVHFSKALWSSGVQVLEVEPLNLGPERKSRRGASMAAALGQKSPVEIQHGQKKAELTDGLGREADLNMGYQFFQSSGTHADTLQPRKVTSGARKTRFTGLMRAPYI
jgi:hypothetical protein